MVTAHGASERALAEARALGLTVFEATCPLVRVAHRSVSKLVREGYHPVIIGKRDHVEVRGLTGGPRGVRCRADGSGRVSTAAERPRFGVAAQTTQPIERVRHLVGLIGGGFPASEVRFIDTVCQPTKQRQHAAVELAQQCDVVVVIGGAHSNNTRELVATLRPLLPAGASRADARTICGGMVCRGGHGGRHRRHVHAGPPHRARWSNGWRPSRTQCRPTRHGIRSRRDGRRPGREMKKNPE